MLSSNFETASDLISIFLLNRVKETWRSRIRRGPTSIRLCNSWERKAWSMLRFMERSSRTWLLSRKWTFLLVLSQHRLPSSPSQKMHWRLATPCTQHRRWATVVCNQLNRTCQTSSSLAPRPSHRPSSAVSSRTLACTLPPPSLACPVTGIHEWLSS